MKIVSHFADYYDEAAREHPAGLIIDRRGGEAEPNLGGRLYGPADPYQVMLQVAGIRYFGVYVNDVFHWGEDVKKLGHVTQGADRQFYVRMRSRGGWWDAIFEQQRTYHPHPLLWSYAAPTTPEALYSNTREWPRLAALQVEGFLPADLLVPRLAEKLLIYQKD